MWYRYSQNIQAIKNRLTNLGASQEVIDYIVNLPPEDISGHIGLVQKNPSITVDELKSQYKPKHHFEMPEEYKNILQKYNEYPAYKNWVETQIRKALHSRTPINTEVFDFIFDWYRSMSEENKKFNINSYDLKRAIQLSEEWHKVIAGKGKGKIYTPLERDEYGNITDYRLVYKFDDGWYIVELNNQNDLMVEGNKMNHCVGSYWSKVQRGYAKIFSLRDPNGKPYVTIELDKSNNIVQARGNSNSVPSPELQQKVNEWHENYKAKEQYYNSDKFDINSLNNPHVALESVRFSPGLIKYIDYRLPNYLQIAIEAVRRNNLALKYISPEMPNYLEFILDTIKQDGLLLKYINTETNNYPKIALEAVKQNGMAIKYINPAINNYQEIALAAVKQDGLALAYVVVDATPNYPKIALEAVKQNGLALQYVPTKLDDYQTIALEAVKQNSFAIKYVDKNIDNYYQIALMAVKKCSATFYYINPNIKNYSTIALEAVKKVGTILNSIRSDIPNYPQIALEAVKNNGLALKYVDKNVQNYQDITLEAVKNAWYALAYVPPNIQNYQQIALAAVRIDGFALKYVHPNTINYQKIVSEAIKQNVWVLTNIKINKKLINYEEIVLEAIQQDKSILKYIKVTPEIILQALKQRIIKETDIPKKYKHNPAFMEKVKEII